MSFQGSPGAQGSQGQERGRGSPVQDSGFTGYATVTTNPLSSVGSMMRAVPVQQHFSGPASTFINVFQQPGSYNISVNFRPESSFPRYSTTSSQTGQANPAFINNAGRRGTQ